MDSSAIDWTVISVGIALAGLILAAIRDSRVTARELRTDMRTEIKGLEERLTKRIDEQDAKLARLDERLGRLEQEQARMAELLGRQEQEQVRLNGVLETLSERLGRQEQEQARLNGVLETLPERLGRLEQEQARLNGVLETIRDGLSYRVERGDRVAEASESYESQE